jgi:hypothetical protein
MAMLLAHGANAALINISQNFESCTDVACGAVVTYVGANSLKNAINHRDEMNVINTPAATFSFDNFFTTSHPNNNYNDFLVIGDRTDNITGDNVGLTRASFSLSDLAAGSYNFLVSFDYVVDTNSSTQDTSTPKKYFSPDDFLVRFETDTGTGALKDVLSIDNIYRNETRQYRFSKNVGFTLATDSKVYLSFSLDEGANDNSSAAGIDNRTYALTVR